MDFGIIITALGVGLITSFHCAGMCGPIALALPLKSDSRISKLLGSLLYGFGKALTYAVIGLMLGAFGQGLALGGIQRWISIVMGAVIMLSVFFPGLLKNPLTSEKTDSVTGKIRIRLGYLFSKRTYFALFLIGLLNGFLPCGPIYAAAGGALATGNLITGSLFMFAFGIGTIPMLSAISIIGNRIGTEIRKKMARLVPVTIVVLGMLFIMRGMSLGIPFVSPAEKILHVPDKKDINCKTHECCH
jgi:hypothetical protein